MFRYLLFCVVLTLSACSGGDRFEEAAFQYRVDSTVNARLDSVQASLQKRNDSLILEQARHRVDSLGKIQAAPAPPPIQKPLPPLPPPQP